MAHDILRRLVYGHVATGIGVVASTAAAVVAFRCEVERALARCLLGSFVIIALLGFMVAAVNAALILRTFGAQLAPTEDIEGGRPVDPREHARVGPVFQNGMPRFTRALVASPSGCVHDTEANRELDRRIELVLVPNLEELPRLAGAQR